MTALETLLSVLPPPALAAKGKAYDGGLPGAAGDFDALEKLRRLAFAESIPAPHVQMELTFPVESQEALGFGGESADADDEIGEEVS